MSASLFWTDQNTEELKRLHATGIPYSKIGAGLGCSRNAAISKSKRLGLTQKQLPRAPKQTIQRKPIIRIIRMNGNSDKMRVMQSVTSTPFICVPVNVVPLNKTLLELESGECRQPYGDGEYVFCAHPVREGSSYCEVHHRKNWVAPIPPKPRYVREAA